jgi:uncharacterized membrane protein
MKISATAPTCRLKSIDALRGIAVLLMIQQHLLYWLCLDTKNSKLLLVLNAMGGLAAPIFVTLAGVSSSLAVQRHTCFNLCMPVRGLILIGFGYLLNFLAPHWFSLGTWYVLHLIGFAVTLSPLLQRVSSSYLLGLMFGVIIMTLVLQTYFNTPFKLYNYQMANQADLWVFFRQMLVEGFFPIFPWMAYFMAGIVSGRWLRYKRQTRIGSLAVILFGIFTGLMLCNFISPSFTKSEFLIRFFTLIPSFYPSLAPIILLLMSLSLLFLYGIILIEAKISLRHLRFLSDLGQGSMTLLIVHVAVIRGAAHYWGFWKIFSILESILLTCSVLLVFTAISHQWRTFNFRFGAEWLLRKASNKILSVM